MTENGSTSQESTELAEKLKEENEKHEQNIEEEKKRHKRKVRAIRQEAGVQELHDRSIQVYDLMKEVSSLKGKIKNEFYEAVNQMTTRKRVTILESVTVRDNSIYEYGQTREMSLATLLDKPKCLSVLKNNIQEEQREEYESALELIRAIDTNFSKYSSLSYESVVEGEDHYIKVKTSSRGAYYLYDKNEYTRVDVQQDRGGSKHKHYLKPNNPKELETLLEHQDEIREAIENVRQKAQSEHQTREEVLHKIADLLKKQKMMGGLVS